MRTTRAARVIAVVALVGLVISLTAAWSRLDPPSPVPEREAGPPAVSTNVQAPRDLPPVAKPPWPSETRQSPSTGSPPVVGRDDAGLGAFAAQAPARPVRIRMASTRIDARVRPVGVASDGQMQLPPNPRVMGWYRYGPAPASGEGGSVVIAGHLDSNRFGLGPLVRLRDIELGESVQVAMSDGTMSTYTVERVQRFDRRGLPATLFSRTGPERLRIVTCGGAFDAEAGGYQQNLVVTAVPSGR